MITAYCGLQGSGKSYGVVQNVIINAIKDDRKIWTNIPLHLDVILRDYPHADITLFDIQDILDDENWFIDILPKGVIFIVDEMWRLWPTGLKSTTMVDQHKEFLAEHRHLVCKDNRSTEIVFVTLGLNQVCAFARDLVATTYISKKMSSIGFSKSFRIDVYQGSISGLKPPKHALLRQIPGKYKPKIFQYYKSHTKSDGGAGKESGADGRANALKGSLVLLVLFVLVTVPVGYYFFDEFINGESSLYAKSSRGSLGPQSASTVDTDSVKSVRSEHEAKKLKVKKVKVVKNDPHPLLRGSIYISSNMSFGATPSYVFSVEYGSSYTDLNSRQIKKLGGSISYISQCLVKITVKKAVRYAYCKKDRNQDMVTMGMNRVSEAIN